MPGNPPSVNTEREALVAYLVQQRDGLKYAAYGLTEEQARARPTVSELSVAGLIKHAATTEKSWIQTMTGRLSPWLAVVHTFKERQSSLRGTGSIV